MKFDKVALRSRPALILMILIMLALLQGCASLDDWPGVASGPDSDVRIEAGLREALEVGSQRAVNRLGRIDGYFADPNLRIPLPEAIEPAATQLRRLGLAGQLDELELAMNRAAELAAAEAGDVFIQAIRGLRPSDARAILNGGDDAATRFLRQTAGPTLTRRYQPIVANALNQVQAYQQFRELAERWNRLPTGRPLDFNLEDYVTERALDGLFQALADEEQRIRRDPVARTTALLREVFGGD
ncbi:MAG: DUF4197 domain-containing protein [Wenzhouxiangella sp.]|nr:MAG: DUF4197 domain-containing protein [Wenzhouxiangella sp.]